MKTMLRPASEHKYHYLRIFNAIVLAVVLLTGCSDEIARIRIQESGQFEGSVTVGDAPLELWTDFDVEFSLGFSAVYLIRYFQDGDLILSLECDPLETKERLMERDATVRDMRKISFLGEMDCEPDLPPGEYEVEVDFRTSGDDLMLFRADLVFRRGGE